MARKDAFGFTDKDYANMHGGINTAAQGIRSGYNALKGLTHKKLDRPKVVSVTDPTTTFKYQGRTYTQPGKVTRY